MILVVDIRFVWYLGFLSFVSSCGVVILIICIFVRLRRGFCWMGWSVYLVSGVLKVIVFGSCLSRYMVRMEVGVFGLSLGFVCGYVGVGCDFVVGVVIIFF